MNRHSLDKKCLHQTPRRWKKRTYGTGPPPSLPALRQAPPSPSHPPSHHPSFWLPFCLPVSSPLVFLHLRCYGKRRLLLDLPRFSSCFLPPLCLFASFAFPLSTPSLIHILHAVRVAPSPLFTSHNGSLPHFSSIITHYYFAPTHCFLSSFLVPHPLHPYTSSQSSPLTLYNVTSPSPSLPPILMNSSSIFPPLPDRFA